jgi:uncharacterized membrane protein YcjF (UPF0283 family)
MTRRFELGPILVAAGSLLLLVSLFLDWYGATLGAWDVFEIVDLVLAAIAVAALAMAAGALVAGAEVADRRWLPVLAGAAVVLVGASIVNPPPAAAGRVVDTGAWVAFGATLAMLVGAVLSLGKVSLSVAVEGREVRQRVSAVDRRQPTAETAAVMPRRPWRPDPATDPAQTAEPGDRTDEG